MVDYPWNVVQSPLKIWLREKKDNLVRGSRWVKWELHRSSHYQLSKTVEIASVLCRRRAFREFHSVHSYVLHIRYGADQSNGNFFIIPPSCEKLSLRRFRVRSPWLECFAEYYFRISIRTLNSNDHFTLSQLPLLLSLSLFNSSPLLSLPPSTLLPPLSQSLFVSLSPLNCGPNIFSSIFYHSTFWVSASPL